MGTEHIIHVAEMRSSRVAKFMERGLNNLIELRELTNFTKDGDTLNHE